MSLIQTICKIVILTQPQSRIIQNCNVLTVASEIHIYPFSNNGIFQHILISVILYQIFISIKIISFSFSLSLSLGFVACYIIYYKWQEIYER